MPNTWLMTCGALANRNRSANGTQHPLPHGLAGQHFIDQEGRTLGHASRATARAEAAPLATEGDELLVMAALTAHP
jgi:hypothetical protein